MNIGQRLEQLGKEVYPADTDVWILISGETVDKLVSEFTSIEAGNYKLKGRSGEIEVLKLIGTGSYSQS